MEGDNGFNFETKNITEIENIPITITKSSQITAEIANNNMNLQKTIARWKLQMSLKRPSPTDP